MFGEKSPIYDLNMPVTHAASLPCSRPDLAIRRTLSGLCVQTSRMRAAFALVRGEGQAVVAIPVVWQLPWHPDSKAPGALWTWRVLPRRVPGFWLLHTELSLPGSLSPHFSAAKPGSVSLSGWNLDHSLTYATRARPSTLYPVISRRPLRLVALRPQN